MTQGKTQKLNSRKKKKSKQKTVCVCYTCKYYSGKTQQTKPVRYSEGSVCRKFRSKFFFFLSAFYFFSFPCQLSYFETCE